MRFWKNWSKNTIWMHLGMMHQTELNMTPSPWHPVLWALWSDLYYYDCVKLSTWIKFKELENFKTKKKHFHNQIKFDICLGIVAEPPRLGSLSSARLNHQAKPYPKPLLANPTTLFFLMEMLGLTKPNSSFFFF